MSRKVIIQLERVCFDFFQHFPSKPRPRLWRDLSVKCSFRGNRCHTAGKKFQAPAAASRYLSTLRLLITVVTCKQLSAIKLSAYRTHDHYTLYNILIIFLISGVFVELCSRSNGWMKCIKLSPCRQCRLHLFCLTPAGGLSSKFKFC